MKSSMLRWVLLWATAVLTLAGPASAKDVAPKGLPASMICTPAQVKMGGKLTLTFTVPHPQELAVVRPDGTYFFIAQRRLGGAKQSSGMPSHLFAGMSNLVIVPSAFRAQRWSQNAPESEPVFGSPGRYKFLLSNELESEFTDMTATCFVTVTTD